MNAPLQNHLFRLVKRPVGEPKREDFAFDTEAVGEIADGQLLVKILYLSLASDR